MGRKPGGKKQILSMLLLTLTALIWGLGFVAQSAGSEHVGPFTFLSSRSLIAGTALLPLILYRSRRYPSETEDGGGKKNLLPGGVLCGAALMIASVLQQIGVGMTTVGKAGFITALYIVIVPLLGLFMRKRITTNVWIGVVLAAAGMYLLCMTEGLHLERGDLFVFLCAICFSGHILCVDYFSARADGVKLACLQFFVCGILSLGPAVFLEKPTLSVLTAAWLPILYAGLFSSGVGYTLQIIAQRNVPPALASLIMSLESVFSALAGWVILGQGMSGREIAGCVLMFAAILLAQLPGERKRHRKAPEK